MEKSTIKKSLTSDGPKKEQKQNKLARFKGICCNSPWCDEDCCRCSKWEEATDEEREGKN